jgi:DNA-binding beta-propeller fold protein YncE
MITSPTILKKLQAPGTKLQRSSKFQIPKWQSTWILKLGIWCFSGAWCLVFGVWSSGCAQVQRPPMSSSPPAKPLVWPAPPEVARISYVQAILRPADIGMKFSAFTRFGHWITGSEKGNEPLLKPFGLALDENDNICLTDTGANAVCYYERPKKKWHRWTTIGNVRFASPVAVAKRGRTLFVADSVLSRIIAFREDGELLFQITNHLERPSGVVILNDRLFVADAQRHVIVVFNLQGDFQREFGRRGIGHAEFNFPTHLAVDGEGNLLVTDSMNARVQILRADGEYKGEIGNIGDSPGHFGRPKGAAVDSAGNVYVVDALFDNMQIFDHSGRLLLNFGETGGQPGQFWLANGIAITRENEILVADSYNHRIQVFKYVGPM